MMHAAGIGLGVRVALLAEGPDVSAAQGVHDVTVGDYTDPATVIAFAERCDVVTFDHEHVPPTLLTDLQARGVLVRPGPAALVAFADRTGWPVIAKTSRGGYDGKGVWKIDDPSGAQEPFASLAAGAQ